MSNFPAAYPRSFHRQQAMASARMNESVAPGDSASAVGSWSVVQEERPAPAQSSAEEVPMQHPEPKATPPQFRKAHIDQVNLGVAPQQQAQGSASAAQPQHAQSSGGVFLDPSGSMPAAAPATSAAKVLLDNAQKQAQRLAQRKN